MFKTIFHWLARFFAPAFELLGQLPPSALSRFVVPL